MPFPATKIEAFARSTSGLGHKEIVPLLNKGRIRRESANFLPQLSAKARPTALGLARAN